MLNEYLLGKYVPVKSAKLAGDSAKPLKDLMRTAPGHVWCTEPLASQLKQAGLAPSSVTYTLPSGINLQGYKIPSALMQQGTAMVAQGKTVFGPLPQLEKTNQLSAPASEIRKQAKVVLDSREGLTLLAEAAAKLDPTHAASAEAFSGVFAAVDLMDLFASHRKKGSAETAFRLTGDMLVIANALVCLLPHGEKAKPALEMLGFLHKSAKDLQAAIYQHSAAVPVP